MITQIKAFFSTKTLHPYLVCLFFVLSGYRQHINIAPIRDALFVFIILILITAFFLRIFNKKNIEKSYKIPVWFTFALIISLFYTNISNFAINFIPYETHAIRIVWLTTMGLLLLSFYCFNKIKHTFLSINIYLNMVFLLYCAWEIIQILGLKYASEYKKNEASLIKKAAPIGKPPNIYLLVLDGYAKSENLKKYWDFDNSSFENQLENKGFFNVKNSKSTYAYTIETIASIFALDSIKSVYKGGKEHGEKSEAENELILQQELSSPNGKLLSLLRSKGYNFKNLSLFYFINEENPFSNYNNLNVFYKDMTILAPIFKFFDLFINEETVKQFKLCNDFASGAKKNAPFFLYLHSMKTHFPFYLDENENASYTLKNTNFSMQEWRYYFQDNENKPLPVGIAKRYALWKNAYLNHLKSSSKEALASIDVILQEDPSAIICLMSDHGFRYLNENDQSINQKEKYENIEFVYFPNKNYQILNDSLNSTEIIKRILEK